MSWFAVTTRPNLEKVATFALQGKGLEAYLPLYRVRRRWSDRIKELDLPLFPGYTFAQFEASQRILVLTTPATTGIVGFRNVPAQIDEADMANVRRIVESGLPVRPWPFLKVGQQVALVDGPLTGVEGVVLELKKQYRLVVSITMLQRSVAVEIDHSWVCAVSGKPYAPAPGLGHRRSAFGT